MAFYMLCRADDRRVVVGLFYDDLTLAIQALAIRGRSKMLVSFEVARKTGNTEVSFRRGNNISIDDTAYPITDDAPRFDKGDRIVDLRRADLSMELEVDPDTAEVFIVPPAVLSRFTIGFHG